jgi:hypothetical protein
MANDQYAAAELSKSTTPVGLCYLMVDLEVLVAELLVAEETLGCTHQAPLADRFSRVGVSNQIVEKFSAWRQSISALACSNSREEDHLAKIAAAEKVGVTLLAEIIECLRTRNQQTSPSDAQIKALAA